jgi:hypothetical protein
MNKLQSPVDVAIEVRDLEEFKRSGSKEAFRKQLGEEFVRRLGAATLDEALAMSLVPLMRQTRGQSRKRVARSPKPENQTVSRSGSQQTGPRRLGWARGSTFSA